MYIYIYIYIYGVGFRGSGWWLAAVSVSLFFSFFIFLWVCVLAARGAADLRTLRARNVARLVRGDELAVGLRAQRLQPLVGVGEP